MRIPLDHNFPEPVLSCLEQFIPDARLLPIRHIHPDLPRLEDRQLLIALHQLGFRALVTNDYKMLENPLHLAALCKTKLAVFAVAGLGDDPIRAAGALLLNMPPFVKAIENGQTGAFRLRPRAPQLKDPWELFKKVAERRKEEATSLYQQLKVTDEDLLSPMVRS